MLFNPQRGPYQVLPQTKNKCERKEETDNLTRTPTNTIKHEKKKKIYENMTVKKETKKQTKKQTNNKANKKTSKKSEKKNKKTNENTKVNERKKQNL